LATSGEPLGRTRGYKIENSVVDFKPFLRQNGKSYEKTSGEREHRQTFRYAMECIIGTETRPVTCSRVTGLASLPVRYRNLGNFRGFYGGNGKSHKKSIPGGHTVGPSSNRRKA